MNVYTFHRADGFYPPELPNDADAAWNPGTLKVVNENTGRRVIWDAPSVELAPESADAFFFSRIFPSRSVSSIEPLIAYYHWCVEVHSGHLLFTAMAVVGAVWLMCGLNSIFSSFRFTRSLETARNSVITSLMKK